jgi:8-oxo-dGTP diphosphatase
MPYTYEFPRPGVTADCVIFAMDARDLRVLLVKRKHPPGKGQWAFPGGFVDANEDLQVAAFRELAEETGLGAGITLEQLRAFGEPGRDPRGHTVTIAFVGFVLVAPEPTAGDDAAHAEWIALQAIDAGQVKLAFDHADILRFARERLAERTLCHGWPGAARPERFTLAELRRVYEAVLGKRIDARAFKARYLRPGLIEPVSRAGRGPAQLYRFR